MPEQLTLPGELRLARRIRKAAGRGTLGHAAILSGRGDLAAAARFLAAAMECEGSGPPCGQCGPCRKVLRGIHPDVITVEDREHKSISLEVLRRTAADAYVLPNEGRRKIYLFPDCGVLEPKSQNVLLKVLEEGPPHAAFLFCAENSMALLPTIRSRAVEWRLAGGSESPGGGAAQAETLCELLCGSSQADLLAFCTELETGRVEREELQALLSEARDLLAEGLAACYGAEASQLARQLAERMGRRRLARSAEVLEDLIRQCNYNVGVGHLAGALSVALWER